MFGLKKGVNVGGWRRAYIAVLFVLYCDCRLNQQRSCSLGRTVKEKVR